MLAATWTEMGSPLLRSEGTGRRQRALLQRQKKFRDRVRLRHLREEVQPLAIDREVACFLAAKVTGLSMTFVSIPVK